MSATFYVETVCHGCPDNFQSNVPVKVCPFCKTDAGLIDIREPVDRD
jgi:rRNA maturation endonuclease Nob1